MRMAAAYRHSTNRTTWTSRADYGPRVARTGDSGRGACGALAEHGLAQDPAEWEPLDVLPADALGPCWLRTMEIADRLRPEGHGDESQVREGWDLSTAGQDQSGVRATVV